MNRTTNLCVIEDTPAVVCAHNSKPPILYEVCRRYQFGRSVDFVPQRHLLVGDIPQS